MNTAIALTSRKNMPKLALVPSSMKLTEKRFAGLKLKQRSLIARVAKDGSIDANELIRLVKLVNDASNDDQFNATDLIYGNCCRDRGVF